MWFKMRHIINFTGLVRLIFYLILMQIITFQNVVDQYNPNCLIKIASLPNRKEVGNYLENDLLSYSSLHSAFNLFCLLALGQYYEKIQNSLLGNHCIKRIKFKLGLENQDTFKYSNMNIKDTYRVCHMLQPSTPNFKY